MTTAVIAFLLVVIIGLLSVIVFLIDGYRRALERKLDALERMIENHVEATYLHRQ